MDDFNETPCPHCPDAFDQGAGYGHRVDCPTFTEPHAIVRELAESDPYDSMGSLRDGEWRECRFCGGKCHASRDEGHEPSCLWRRARELYPKEG